ncbi:MAG: hypothetical protein GY696_18740, partial [Gammaproteobacteria bacterium]|nr:hypothetical protein [Gammaproteobacteria bacterium]
MENQVADCLSRMPVQDASGQIPFEQIERGMDLVTQLEEQTALGRGEIREETLKDTTLQSLKDCIKNGWPKDGKISEELKPYKLIQHELYIVDEMILRTAESGEDKFIIPQSLVKKVIQLAHSAHEGKTRTKAKNRSLYWWPYLNATVEAEINNCESCQASDKSGSPIKAPIQPVEYPCRPMAKSSVDITGPYLNAPRGYKYFTIWMDYYSRWPELMATEGLPTSGEIIH